MTPEEIAYDKYKNLKIAANEVGIKWQTLYCRLKSQGVNVVGDKLRYGSDRDRLAAIAESEFKRIIPFAVNNNEKTYQAKVDFDVNGLKVDVKSSKKRLTQKNSDKKSWTFSLKKQAFICDFICCFCMGDNKDIAHIIVIPREFFGGMQTLTVGCSGNSKWMDYRIDEYDLLDFFNDISKRT